MNRKLAIVAGIGLLAAAYGVAATTPSSQLVEAPFGFRGALGDTVSSPYLIATVHEASLAHEVELGFWRGTTSGVWFVAEATVESARLTAKRKVRPIFCMGCEPSNQSRCLSRRRRAPRRGFHQRRWWLGASKHLLPF